MHMPNFVLTWDVSVEGEEDTVTQGYRADLGVTEDVAVLFAAALDADSTYSNVSLTCLEVTPRQVTVTA